MTYKICKNCGNRVDGNAKFCPNCKSQSFRLSGELTVPDDSLTHKLFYWNYNNYYMISKTKVFSIFVFVVLILTCITSPYPLGVLGLTLIFTALAFLVSFVLHKVISHPSQNQLESSDYGLLSDMGNLLVNWQDKKTGYFRLSKTKIISIVLFVGFIILGTAVSKNLFVGVIVAAVFTLPIFIAGFIIHKLTNKDPGVKKIKEPKKPKQVKKQAEIEKPKEAEIPVSQKDGIDEDLLVYKREIEELNVKFDSKEKAARELIEKRFAPPQLTYTRFISSVDNASKLFKSQYESAMNIIKLASDDTPRIRQELDAKVDILKKIISKMDALANELVLSIDDAKEDDVDSLIEDMDVLIKSVDDYK